MDKALVAQGVANKIWATEKAIDAALAEAAQLMNGIAEARTELRLSAVVAAGATSKVAQAIATLADARNAVVEAHGELADVKLQIGVRTKMIGVLDKPPPPSTAELRQVG